MPSLLVSRTNSAAIAAALIKNKPDTDKLSQDYLEENRDGDAAIPILFIGVLVTLILVLRCYGRLFVQKKFGLDDWLAVLTVLPYFAFITLSLILIRLGSGRHIEYIQYVLDNPTTNKTQVLDFAAHVLYTTALFICRLSGLAFYRRIGERHRRIIRTIDCAVVILILALIPQIVLLIVHCKPVTGLWPYAWQAESANFTCLAWGQVYVTNSGLSLFCDMIIFAIPAALIVSIKRSVPGKVKLSLLLLPGVFVIGISSVRVYLVVVGQWNLDQSWSYDPLLAVENAEIGGTLLALCVPALKPLGGRLSKWLQDSHIGSSYLASSRMPKDEKLMKPSLEYHFEEPQDGKYVARLELGPLAQANPEAAVKQSRAILKRMDVDLSVSRRY